MLKERLADINRHTRRFYLIIAYMPNSNTVRQKEYLNASALARRLGISRATLYVYLRKGKLPEPERHETTNYPQWRIEDVPQIQEMIREGGGR